MKLSGRFKLSLIAAVAISILLGITCSGDSSGSGKGDIAVRNGSMKLPADAESAIFAGGCFWCMEPPFERLDGVLEVVSGYTGGSGDDPQYEDYASKGHVEAVRITYDRSVITYEQLLEVFWRQIDPTDPGGQFVDRGPEYRSAIFFQDDEQMLLAENSRRKLSESGRYDKPIVTEIVPASKFWPAEEYHQDYYKKNKIRYKFYRSRSGRDRYLDEIWGENRKSFNPAAASGKYLRPSERQLRDRLTRLQYEVTQQEGTEPPFENDYWDNHREGIYVDIVSGEPLFSSRDKFDSGTGWPSFTRPLRPEYIVERPDRSLFVVRTEVRSKHADSHLGHVFEDGPEPTGLRYCINSAALRFIPREELEREGYGEFVQLFE